MREDRLHGRVRGPVGLHDDLARAPSPAGATGHLLQEVVGPLGSAKVGQLEHGVRVDHAHERDLGEVEPLGYHLRAHEHRALRRIEALEQALVGTLSARGVRVHTDDLDTLGQEHGKLVLDALGSHAVGAQVATSAVGATGRGVWVGAHGPAAAASVAHEGMGALVVRERRGAVRALGHAAALAAHEEVREAAPVEEQHGLLAPLRHALERAAQGLREDRARAAPKLRRHVHDGYFGKHGPTRPLGHLHARPASLAPRAHLAATQALERRRCRAEHQGASPLLGHACRDLARVVARARVLLVGRLVLLVDDDEANVGERRKERGAGAHHHVDSALAHEVPLVEALAGGQTRVEHGHVVAKARAEASHGLRRERDLGHEDQRAFA